MNRILKNIIAISIAILPINIIMIWYRLTQTEDFSTTDMTVYPLLFGVGTIILILLLNKYLLKTRLKKALIQERELGVNCIKTHHTLTVISN